MIPAAALAALLCACAPVVAQSPGSAPAGKRVARPTVAPLVVDGVRIGVADPSVAPPGRRGGTIVADDARTGKRLWLLTVYVTPIDPKLETDVQEVFIARLQRQGRNAILVEDENRRRWIVDLRTRAVRPG